MSWQAKEKRDHALEVFGHDRTELPRRALGDTFHTLAAFHGRCGLRGSTLACSALLFVCGGADLGPVPAPAAQGGRVLRKHVP